MEGFFLMKDRYWINRFESRIDKFSVDELMKKNKESDAFMYRCKFCSNGTPILKLAVHPF